MPQEAPAAGPLAGKRILVVEDEVIVSMLLEDILADAGATVLGPAARVAQALEVLGQGPVDAALLDLNLAGEVTVPVAQALRAREIPFAFATGYGAAGLPDGFAGQAVLPKPFQEHDVLRVLGEVLGPTPG